MTSKKIKTPLLPGRFYHIYNRGNNQEKIFYLESNYQLFLKKYDYYLAPFIDTYAYSLLPNHFHLLIRTKDIFLIQNRAVFGEQFRKMFISYSQLINIQEHRNGSLFSKYYKRVEINSQNYLKRLVFYIHFNPQKHGVIDDFRKYKYSSFSSFLSNKPSKILRAEVIEWFNDIREFVEYHDNLCDE
jgi:REP element-mobilizing transposase RayT